MVKRSEGRMRRIALVMVATVAAVVLLFSYRTSTSGSGVGTAGAPPGIVKPVLTGPGTAQPTPPATASAGATDSGILTVNGTTVDNGYGPVQVQVQISSGRIVDATTLALPRDGHSERINSYAVPQLREEVLRAQSAHVDAISGATDTSMAYTRSLQAALDAAHLGS
ncbi:FMN-binding protein [Rugosimonospora africana]|uniref:FMN-binding protein n=1 Tax=Rugosimonospora africana TaxID=556532 RepID=A0A8J3VX45_9ACTN|nr:FMN-binding protein [Rugosimonospora africana]GIH21519.1 FMN-binding protein [Rugosimonospora africana]